MLAVVVVGMDKRICFSSFYPRWAEWTRGPDPFAGAAPKSSAWWQWRIGIIVMRSFGRLGIVHRNQGRLVAIFFCSRLLGLRGFGHLKLAALEPVLDLDIAVNFSGQISGQ